MRINSPLLTAQEQTWFDLILEEPIKYISMIRQQINSALVRREYYDNHIFLFLEYDQRIPELVPVISTTTIDMLVQHTPLSQSGNGLVRYDTNPSMECLLGEHGEYPTMFTLYIRDGLVRELEIYNVDGSDIDTNHICIGRKDYVIEPALKPGTTGE